MLISENEGGKRLRKERKVFNRLEPELNGIRLRKSFHFFHF